jgi:IS1 family transposase
VNRLSLDKRTQIVACLVEGNSIRATCRMTGAAKNTVTKLLVDLGEACSRYQDEVMQDLPCRTLEVDEIWTFVYAKAKNVPVEKQDEDGVGDVWTWVAIDADTKLVPAWLVGSRDPDDANAFMHDLAARLANRVQLTTDGFKPYLHAINDAFDEIDYATLIKIYGSVRAEPTAARRYSPSVCLGTERRIVRGTPNVSKISTSYVERQNLTMRMSMRRFTRLTNAFSKKVENHAAAISLHFMHYNFSRVHGTLKTTPALAAGITDHVWAIEEIVALLEAN